MKNWPLWSLFAVAVSLSIVLVVPDLRAVVVPSGAVALTCAVIVAWIFVITHAIDLIVKWISRYKQRRE
jgi:CBS-domain-containing membrane protein